MCRVTTSVQSENTHTHIYMDIDIDSHSSNVLMVLMLLNESLIDDRKVLVKRSGGMCNAVFTCHSLLLCKRFCAESCMFKFASTIVTKFFGFIFLLVFFNFSISLFFADHFFKADLRLRISWNSQNFHQTLFCCGCCCCSDTHLGRVWFFFCSY